MDEFLKMDTSSGIIPYIFYRVSSGKVLLIKYMQAFIQGK